MTRRLLNHAAMISVLVLLSAGSGFALGGTIRYVDDNAPNDPGPGDPTVSDPLEDGSSEHPFDAIQEGINASSNGDEVVIMDGVYRGLGNKNLDYEGRLITVRSASDDPRTCVIDCENEGRGFSFHRGEYLEAVLSGVTVCRGYLDEESPVGSRGCAVLCQSSSPRFKRCVFRDNYGGNDADGVGMYCSYARPFLSQCIFEGNYCKHQAAYGAGLYCDAGGNPTLLDCVIRRNYGAGVLCIGGAPILINCTIANNVVDAYAGSGVECYDGDPLLVNCVFTGNVSEDGGCFSFSLHSQPVAMNCTLYGNRGQAMYYNNSDPTLTNCILWNDGEHEITGPNGDLVVTYCDVRGGWPGAGNIDVDPMLTWDCHLKAESPCCDAGDPEGAYEDWSDWDGEPRAAGAAADIGSDEFIDVDEDALPDWWEQAHFGTPTAADPAGDEDDDDRVNLVEYINGTEPLHAPQTLYVDPAGNDDWDGLASVWNGQHGPKATIQCALDAALPREGDRILLADGTYAGAGNRDLSFEGKTLTLRSAAGNPADCVIDCGGQGRGFCFRSAETEASVLCGLTVANGYADEHSLEGARGGAVFCEDISCPTLVNCRFVNGRAQAGGGVYLRYESVATFVNCLFSRNQAEYGGGVYTNNSAARFVQCTFADNAAETRSGGIYVYGDAPGIANCILWNNTREQIHSSNTVPQVTYCDVQGGWNGAGNIAVDPRFVDPDGPDNDPDTWEDNDYALQADSPCIDAGDDNALPSDTFDLNGDGATASPLPLDALGRLRCADRIGTPDTGLPHSVYPGLAPADLGAYEFQCSGDLNGNGGVQLADLALLLSRYGATGAWYGFGDLDQDGDVDLADLSALLAVYGTTCE